MNYYRVFKYTDDADEYQEAFRKKLSAKYIQSSGLFLIEFAETNDLDEAEFICRNEARTFNQKCFVMNNSRQIFLVDYTKKDTE